MTGEPIDPGVVELAGQVSGLARGGHTDAGDPGARATAVFLEPPAMVELLDGR